MADPLTLERAAAQFSRWMVLPAVGLAVLGSAVHAALLRLPVVDDAAISIAYGQSFFAGAGLRLTPASPPVEGFSNPLWVLLLGVSGPLHLDALAFSRWLGIALGALALVFVALAVPAATGRRLRPVDVVGSILVAASPNYAYWICSGMESGLHALLLAASVWALVRDFRLGHGLTSGLVLAGLVLTRPEAPLVILAAAALWASWLPGARRRPGRPEVMLVGVLALVGGLYLLFRWAYFAHLLPNTYFAKQYWNFRPQEYLLGFARAYPLPLAVSSVLGILGLVSRSARRPASLALAFLLCDVVFVWVVKADWMAQWRFLGPLWPMLGVLVGSGLCAIAERSSRASLPVPRPVVPLLACLGTLGLCVPAELTRFDSARRDAGFPATFVRNNALRLRQRLRDLGIEQARVGLADIGGTGLALREDRVLDIAGLADYALAIQGGNFPAMEDYLVGEGLPDLVDAHGPSGHVASFARLMRHYRPIGGGVWLLGGLERGRDPRCPGEMVGPVLTTDVAELRRQLDGFIGASDPGRAVDLVRCIQAHRPAAFPELRPLSARAAEASVRAERAGGLEWALRFSSLATILADENAHLRRRTEQLRRRLFPPPAKLPGAH
ncbi:MAG TPA: hypothetical protein VFF12_16745 [Myxococcaceae bacterium]|nr:hypothetical protein [Myxococcaceae bacterium]